VPRGKSCAGRPGDATSFRAPLPAAAAATGPRRSTITRTIYSCARKIRGNAQFLSPPGSASSSPHPVSSPRSPRGPARRKLTKTAKAVRNAAGTTLRAQRAIDALMELAAEAHERAELRRQLESLAQQFEISSDHCALESSNNIALLALPLSGELDSYDPKIRTDIKVVMQHINGVLGQLEALKALYQASEADSVSVSLQIASLFKEVAMRLQGLYTYIGGVRGGLGAVAGQISEDLCCEQDEPNEAAAANPAVAAADMADNSERSTAPIQLQLLPEEALAEPEAAARKQEVLAEPSKAVAANPAVAAADAADASERSTAPIQLQLLPEETHANGCGDTIAPPIPGPSLQQQEPDAVWDEGVHATNAVHGSRPLWRKAAVVLTLERFCFQRALVAINKAVEDVDRLAMSHGMALPSLPKLNEESEPGSESPVSTASTRSLLVGSPPSGDGERVAGALPRLREANAVGPVCPPNLPTGRGGRSDSQTLSSMVEGGQLMLLAGYEAAAQAAPPVTSIQPLLHPIRLPPCRRPWGGVPTRRVPFYRTRRRIDSERSTIEAVVAGREQLGLRRSSDGDRGTLGVACLAAR